MAEKFDLREHIAAANSGKKVPVVDIVRSNPELAATISKLIAPSVRPIHDSSGNRKMEIPAINNFSALSNGIAEKAHDAQSIMQLFPDMELSAQILISSILSPKDMGTGEINYSVPNDLMFESVAGPLVAIIKSYFTKDYKIQPLLPKILRQILFESGSYPIAVIPESSLDDFINGTAKISSESVSDHITPDGIIKSIGILGESTALNTVKTRGLFNIANESVSDIRKVQIKDTGIHFGSNDVTPFINVYDNPFVFKLPQFLAKQKLTMVAESIRNLSKNPVIKKDSRTFLPNNIESGKLNDVQLSSLVYKTRYGGSATLRKIKTQSELARSTVGRPLIIKLTSESTIPVFTPGHEEQHLGYFVIIDREGNPVTGGSGMDHFGNLQNRLQQVNANMSSYLLEKAKTAFQGAEPHMDLTLSSRLFGDVVEADLLSRLRNGVYGQNIAIGRNDNIYRLMFSRILSDLYTNIVYIPGELVTYFAYRFDKHGIGKSLMEDMRILNSLRAMTLFSRVMASIKNSIGRTDVKLKLDESDPNPTKTIEVAMDEISRTRQQYFPLGLNSPSDLVDWMQRSGYQFSFEGHPGIPDVSIDFEEKNSNYVKPDQELDEELRKRAIMSVGLSPETVDAGIGAEFATSVVANNILLAKRVMQIQEVIIPQVTDHARKVAFNDGNLVIELKKSVKDNLDKIRNTIDKNAISEELLKDDDKLTSLVVSEFLSNFEVSLPQPDSSTLKNQAEAFKEYEESLDNAIKYYISAELMPQDLSGEIASKADDIRNILKGHFMRKWMQENGYLLELNSIVSDSGDKKPGLNIIEIQDQHISALTRAGINLLNKTKPVADAANVDVKAITGDNELSGSASPIEGSGSGGSFDSNSSSSLDDAAPDNNDVGADTADIDEIGGLPDLGSIPG